MSGKQSEIPLVPTAYAVVPRNEKDIASYQATATATLALDNPAMRTVGPEYSDMPEAQGLTWTDDFFDDEDDICAVFDLDYENMEKYYSSLGWLGFCVSSFFFPNLFGCLVFSGFPCFLNKNVRWNARAQHVAITRDGIRFVHDRRRTCWGMSACDAGKLSKTIPFEKITDCDIVDPAGNTCLCVPNTLYSLHINTASSGGNGSSHELTLVGLQNPEAFKKLVLAMKRNTRNYTSALPVAMQMADREAGGNEDVATLLREIRDELRQHNENLRAQPVVQGEPSAPHEFS